MIDPFGRAITYLRVSVTDRCDLRCVYCMAEDMTFLPKAELLSLEELDRLCGAFIRLGMTKIRITGGEPLVRRDVMTLFARARAPGWASGLRELTLTTNGTQLARHAAALHAAGVRRVNVSLDTLDAAKFAAITRWGRLDRVLDGIFAARAAGLAVKINTVALRGVNEDEFDAMLAWCGGHGFRSVPDRNHADGRDRRRPHRPVPAAVAGARAAAPALDAGRDRLSHRRPGALFRRRRDRHAASASSRR